MTSVVFAPSSTTSSALDLTVFQDTGRSRANALIFPSGFVSGTVYVNSSSDLGATFQPIYVNGTRYGVAAAAGEEVLLDFGVMDSVSSFQLVSSVTQTAGCTVTVIVVDASKAASVGGEFGGGGGGGGSNASVGTNGATAPTSSTQISYVNAAGNATPVSQSTPLPVADAPYENIVQTIVTLTANTSAALIAANTVRKSLRWMVLTSGYMTVAPGTGAVTVGNGMNYSGSGGVGQQGGSEVFSSDVPTSAFSAISAAGVTVAVWEGQ
jgi:hypothetical protein